MSSVSVIIPNFNGCSLLKECLKALEMQSFKDFETIVVDNGSTDGTLAMLRQDYKDTIVIENRKNEGFCKAVNQGAERATAPYLLLLNNDTIPDSHFVEELYKAIGDSDNIFSCQACMVTKEDKNILDGAGDLYCALGWSYARGKGKDKSKYNKITRIFSACGGAAIYRRDVFLRLGGLDETHFAYLEDLDLGYKAKIAGYTNLYIPKALVVHLGSATSGSSHNEFKVSLSAQNNILVIRKNMPIVQRIINFPLLFIGFFVKYLYFIKKGLGHAYMDGIKKGRRITKEEAFKKKKVDFSVKNLFNYLEIQLQLWINIFRRL